MNHDDDRRCRELLGKELVWRLTIHVGNQQLSNAQVLAGNKTRSLTEARRHQDIPFGEWKISSATGARPALVLDREYPVNRLLGPMISKSTSRSANWASSS